MMEKPFELLWNALRVHQFSASNGTPLGALYSSAAELEQTVYEFLPPDFVPLSEATNADGSAILPLSCGDFIFSFLVYMPATASLYFEEYHDRGGIEHSVSRTLSKSDNDALQECGWLKLNDIVKGAYRATPSYVYSNPKPF